MHQGPEVKETNGELEILEPALVPVHPLLNFSLDTKRRRRVEKWKTIPLEPKGEIDCVDFCEYQGWGAKLRQRLDHVGLVTLFSSNGNGAGRDGYLNTYTASHQS
ncbi:unnamed protein product [Linum trigynum]|uniref:Uncharacterized protein n=1 Tax=Linum trigynum TaxID=586398 RepID=A0AAV2CW67_9ROSI